MRPTASGAAPTATVVVFGVLGYVLGAVVWVLTSYNLLAHVGNPNDIADDTLRPDAVAIWVICLVQTGYPLVALAQVVWLNCFASDLNDPTGKRPMPGDQMSGTLSFLKDGFLGGLDITTKGGLALYSVMRAHWVVAGA